MQIEARITGGSSYAAIFLPKIDETYWVVIRHFGDYMLRDLRVLAQTIPPSGPPLFQFVYPSLPPGAIEKVQPIEFRVDHGAFQIDFKHENGFWGEAVKFRRVGEHLRFAVRVWKLGQHEQTGQIITLYEDAHPEYPREADGTLDMSFGSIDVSDLTPATESNEDMIRRSLGMR